MDLETLYNSSKVEDIMKFYDMFPSSVELIDWMRERKSGEYSFFEVEGDPEIVVVIITVSHLNSYSRRCYSEIYKGAHLVFVESGENNTLFNYSDNANRGIERALKKDPEWVVVSNDDMLKVDNFEVLRDNLKNIDAQKVKTVFTNPPGKYHSYMTGIGQRTLIRDLILNLKWPLGKEQVRIEKKFGVEYVPAYPFGSKRLLTKNNLFFPITSSFGIFSADFLRNEGPEIYDRTYINLFEDTDISIRLTRNKQDYDFVDFKIGDMIGSSLGNTLARHIRSFANRAYLNFKIENGLLTL